MKFVEPIGVIYGIELRFKGYNWDLIGVRRNYLGFIEFMRFI